ncbi:MAG: phosphatase PAP2 family protein [Anaeromyxobacteraceae bacterium]
MRSARVLAALLSLSLAAPALGQEQPQLTPLSYDWTVDGIVTGATAAAVVTLQLMKNQLAPLECKWCTPGSIDGDLARSLAWSNPKTANTISDVMQFLLPIGAIGYGVLQGYRLGDPTAGWSSALLITEATSIALLANVIVKYAVGRARPYVWMGQPGLYGDPRDENLSFFSGHTTLAFAVAVSAGTLFLMQGMPGAGWVLGGGLALAAFTGYLRMGAEQHYLTDVLTGAAVGSLVGWAVPYLFHRPRKPGEAPQPGALIPSPGGIAIAW